MVGDMCTKPAITASPDTTIREAAHRMRSRKVGALVVGLARACAVHLLPQVELFVIYAVMAVVLAFRPQGLFGRVAGRKI